MTQFGMTLSSEEHDPRRLVEIAALAEDTRLRLRVDLRPLPPVGRRAGPLAVRVVDPRRHRRAHRAASTSASGSPARRSASIRRSSPRRQRRAPTCSTAASRGASGSGEALNEHILGDRWPPADLRLVDARGGRRDRPPALGGRGGRPTGASTTSSRTPGSTTRRRHRCRSSSRRFGRRRPNWRRRIGDGLWVTRPRPRTPSSCWRDAGRHGPGLAQLDLCWADDRDEAIKTAHRIWPNDGRARPAQPGPVDAGAVRAGGSVVTPEMVAESVPCGPDAGRSLDESRRR